MMSRTHLATVCLLLIASAAAWAQTPTTRPSSPPATAPATRPASPGPMVFDFRDAPVDSVLDALAEHYNLTIIRTPQPIPGRITIINRGKDTDPPLTAAQAVDITNSLLLPMGYGLIEANSSLGDAPVYRVSTTNEIRKQAPVGISQ